MGKTLFTWDQHKVRPACVIDRCLHEAEMKKKAPDKFEEEFILDCHFLLTLILTFCQDTRRDNRPPSPPRPQEPPPPQPPLPPMAPGTNIQVRKDYNPKVARAQAPMAIADNYLISPITGQKVPAHQFDDHMKISLLDPKWKEQRDRHLAEKKQQESVYASGKGEYLIPRLRDICKEPGKDGGQIQNGRSKCACWRLAKNITIYC